MRKTRRLSVAAALIIVWGRAASAQVITVQSNEVPVAEVAVNLGLWNLLGENVFAGVRAGHNLNRHVGGEVSFDARERTGTSPAFRLSILNGRVGTRFTSSRGRTGRVFLTGGVAAGHGTSYHYSPMVGAGVQTDWMQGGGALRVAFRGDLQIFTRGRTIQDKGRVVFGLAVGIGP